MKRNQPAQSKNANCKPRIVDPRRLVEARGGADLGIAVAHRPLAPDGMQQQHNEALIRLW
ncbi:MAG TPA: hypothetical protein VHT91_01385 [Kofleriaceae bacterium]|jgi:hypothetical protein|nr:hypothetical protein [Kofleriaceae bacterium]